MVEEARPTTRRKIIRTGVRLVFPLIVAIPRRAACRRGADGGKGLPSRAHRHNARRQDRERLHFAGGLASFADPGAFAAWLAELRHQALVVYGKPPSPGPNTCSPSALAPG